MKKLVIFALAALILTATIGCTGAMDGVIRRDAARFQITYTDSRVAVAELIAVLPSGERLQGKPERLDTTKEMTSAVAAGSIDEPATFPALQTFPGNVKATLSGSKGGKMGCRFKLTDMIIGFSSGGFGLCQMSDGRVIDVFF
ncbi:MAG: hypothetical protein JSW26_05470 [Desulfobacterales bacterium]|nr:MAG: hypothetical protein JSW26_05470 [Desulfobacterales bacterium]